jgi:putative peptide zinc metalloprotease protein
MSEGLFSQHWYRVADLKPMLRSHVRVDRHSYRDETWYLLRDELSGRQHRLSWSAFQMVGRLDGRLTSQEIWVHVVEKLGDAAPSQGEVIELFGQLNEAELIQTEVTPDVAQLFAQRDRRKKSRDKQKMNPLAFRVSVGNPTNILDAVAPLLALFLKPWALILFSCFALITGIAINQDWRALTAYGHSHLSQPGFILMMWLVYPLVKLLHEVAHGATVKAWGGEVKEFGVTLMMLFPIPFIDASAASGFRLKTRRTVVSLIGIFCEVLLAGIAFWIWSSANSDFVRELAFAIVFTCGVSTILVNANPLMKFDAYYALTDWLESPGLAQRSIQYLKYCAQRYLFRVKNALPPTVGKGERIWLIGYGIASASYRWMLGFAACLWIAEYSAGLAIAFAIWFVFVGALAPLFKLAKFIWSSPALSGVRLQAWTVSVAVVGIVIATLWLIPVADATRAEGVVWLSDNALVRSETDGVVQQLLVQDMQLVQAGDPIIALDDPVLFADLERAKARLSAVEINYQLAVARSSPQVRSLADDLNRLVSEVATMEQKTDRLIIKATRAGQVNVPNSKDLIGSWIEKGKLMAFVFQPEDVLIKTVVKQQDIGLVRAQTRSVSVKQSDFSWQSSQAQVLQHQPESTFDLPSAALGEKGGGELRIDPTDSGGLRSQDPIFLVDVSVPGQKNLRVGARALVRFEHRHDSIFSWLNLQVERTRLKHFDGSGGNVALRT